jgi:hypothetical protein
VDKRDKQRIAREESKVLKRKAEEQSRQEARMRVQAPIRMITTTMSSPSVDSLELRPDAT